MSLVGVFNYFFFFQRLFCFQTAAERGITVSVSTTTTSSIRCVKICKPALYISLANEIFKKNDFLKRKKRIHQA
jgi:hypothetical protein